MKLIVLNFVLGKVFVHNLTKAEYDLDGDELLELFNYRESDCQYMVTTQADFIEYIN